MPDPDIRKPDEPTVIHNARQLLMLLPVLGSLAVGVCGLITFAIGIGNANHYGVQGGAWLIGASLGLIASGIGFGVLGWLVWRNQ